MNPLSWQGRLRFYTVALCISQMFNLNLFTMLAVFSKTCVHYLNDEAASR